MDEDWGFEGFTLGALSPQGGWLNIGDRDLTLQTRGTLTAATNVTSGPSPATNTKMFPPCAPGLGFTFTASIQFLTGSQVQYPIQSFHFQNLAGDDVAGFDVQYESTHSTQFAFYLKDISGDAGPIRVTLARDVYIPVRYQVIPAADPTTGGTGILEVPLGSPIGTITLHGDLTGLDRLTIQQSKTVGTLTNGYSGLLHFACPSV